HLIHLQPRHLKNFVSSYHGMIATCLIALVPSRKPPVSQYPSCLAKCMAREAEASLALVVEIFRPSREPGALQSTPASWVNRPVPEGLGGTSRTDSFRAGLTGRSEASRVICEVANQQPPTGSRHLKRRRR